MLTGTSAKGRYNSHINGKKYGFKQHRRNLKIVIERDSARFVSFHYIDYEKKQENITDVPLLIRNGTEEPYAFYLHSIIQSMYLNRKPDQSMKDFYQLIGEIREKATEYRIEDDTLAYDLATYYELTEVRDTLIKQGQEGRKTIDPDAVQLVPESKKYNIRALVRVSLYDKAMSRRFEKYNF